MKFYVGNRELFLDENDFSLSFGDKKWIPDIRKFSAMKELYEDENEINDAFGMYYMYRGVYFTENEENLFEENNLRYDITILVPQKVGNENNKTFGHFHPKNESGKYYEEIYEVLYGNAIYLQQKGEDFFYTKAKKGEAVLMKEGYGHVSLNNSETEYLVMADIVNKDFSSVYNDYKDKKGGAFYYKNGNFEKNKHYGEVNISESFEKLNGNIYDDFLENPEKYLFLN